MFVKSQPWRYGGNLAVRGTGGDQLSDYQKVTFVLPTNTTKNLSGLGQLPQLSGAQWLGIAAVAAAVYWFGFRKK
jgi:hypothetical protein